MASWSKYSGRVPRVRNGKPGGTIAEYKAESMFGEHTDEEREFMMAMDCYKREHSRPFPSWAEVLAVAKQLGYRKKPK